MIVKVLTRLLGTLTWKLVIDTLEAVLGRIKWAVILERLLTRVLVAMLDWVASFKTNTLTQETVADLKEQLLKNGLKKAEE